MQILTAQELHNLAMYIVGEKLEKMGYEFQAINSQLKRHPQYVLFKKGEPTIFVLVKATANLQNPNDYDVFWMETFVAHAKKQKKANRKFVGKIEHFGAQNREDKGERLKRQNSLG